MLLKNSTCFSNTNFVASVSEALECAFSFLTPYFLTRLDKEYPSAKEPRHQSMKNSICIVSKVRLPNGNESFELHLTQRCSSMPLSNGTFCPTRTLLSFGTE